MEEKYFKNSAAEIFMEDGIINIVYFNNATVTLEVAKELVDARLKMANGGTYPTLADLRKSPKFEKAGRDYLSRGIALKGVSAGCLIIRNQIYKLLGNFFIKVHSPQVPVKLFTSKEDAIKWLNILKNLN